jgi:Tfp pilus assembly protein PilF
MGNRRKKSKKAAESTAPVSQLSELSGIRFTRGWVLAGILIFTFLAFANSLRNGFAYDDLTQILDNQQIRNFANLPTVFVTDAWFWRVQQDKDPVLQPGPTTPYYRPMIIAYLMVGWHLFGDLAFGWHLANVLMHLLVVFLSFRLFEKISGDLRISAIGAVLFAVHPLRSESVAWISGVTDLLLAIFVLSSFYLYLRFREESRKSLFAWALVLYGLGLFAKEPAVCLPVIIAAYEILVVTDSPLKQRIRSTILLMVPFLGVSVIYFLARQYALGFLLADPNYTTQTYREVFLTIPLVVWKYVALLFWPMELSLFHATTLVSAVTSWRFIVPVLGLLLIAALIPKVWRSTTTRFGLIWFIINMLPVLNLKAFAPDFMVQERYTYIPSIGFSLVLAVLIVNLPFERWVAPPRRAKAMATAVILLSLLLGGKSMAQNRVWEHDLALWEHGIEVAPDQNMARFILGHKYINLRRFDLAAEQLEKYMLLNQENLIVMSNLAACHLYIYQAQAATNQTTADRAHLDRAIALCEKGLAIGNIATLWDTLGTTYTFETELKNLDRAVACYQRGMRADPNNPMLSFHMGATLMKKGSYDDALQYLERARERRPDFPDVYKMLGYTQQAKGRINDAINNLNRYVQMYPDAFDAAAVTKLVQDLSKLQQDSDKS